MPHRGCAITPHPRRPLEKTAVLVIVDLSLPKIAPLVSSAADPVLHDSSASVADLIGGSDGCAFQPSTYCCNVLCIERQLVIPGAHVLPQALALTPTEQGGCFAHLKLSPLTWTRLNHL